MRESVDVLLHAGAEKWLSFRDPARIVAADSADDVRSALVDVERLTRDSGYYAVGFVCYEAGAAFGVPTPEPDWRLPLVWFALFDPATVRQVDRPTAPREPAYELGPLRPTLDRPAFDRAFSRIKGHLAAGDTYQANFTFRMTASFAGDPLALFADLIDAQRGAYSVLVTTAAWSICCASPELFFELEGLTVRSRPMKGTVARGRTLAEDQRHREQLRTSPKQQAENVMIVDMVRNDLGRVAVVGSVEVPELFTAERYPNAWQMTSLVTGRTAASLDQMFAALHPPASVTGAPKIRTVELLSELEGGPRGIYTGAIGHVRPDGNATFNVAIRTAVLDHRAGSIEFGIGSGIVWDSEAGAEYDECLLKGSVLGRRSETFHLLETLRWTPDDGFGLLERHLGRLRDSAEYFSFACDPEAVRSALERAVGECTSPRRVRLLVARDGGIEVQLAELPAEETPVQIALGLDPVDPADVWLFHKTTRRDVYDRARERAGPCDDVILWNTRGEVTEATIANVVVEIDAVQWTPPIECGLLGGTYRAELLACGEVRERVVTVDELKAATRVWLVNSVRGRREAKLLR